MFNRLFLVLAGVAMAASATGCCCLGGCFGANRCCPSPCGPGGCSPSYYPPATTSYYQGDTSTAALAPTTTITTAPVYTTTTALMPSLPTY